MWSLVVLLVCGNMVSSFGRVYTPCELVKSVKEYWDYMGLEVADYEELIPTIVCIAGYRQYNTSYQLLQPNGQGYRGIFGIHDLDANDCNTLPERLTDDNISDDLYCLRKIILLSPATMRFYGNICRGYLVNEVPCAINNYVMIDVFDPIQKEVFDNNFANTTGVPPKFVVPKESEESTIRP